MPPVVRVIASVEPPEEEKILAESVFAPKASVPCVSVAVRVDPSVRLSPSVVVMPEPLMVIGKSSV